MAAIIVHSSGLDNPDETTSTLTADTIPGLPVSIHKETAQAGTTYLPHGDGIDRLIIPIGGISTFESPTLTGTMRVGDALYKPESQDLRLIVEDNTQFGFRIVAWRSVTSVGGRPSVTVRSLDRTRMSWAYRMDLQDAFDTQIIPGLPFGSVFGAVRPHSISKLHGHHDGEIFLILNGRSEVRIDEESYSLTGGDLIYLPPFSMHYIANDSDESFDLVSLYWENIGEAARAVSSLSPRNEIAARTLVFCPPPTPNGQLHVGHVAGPYLKADHYTRALRTIGKSATLVTGTDDHQSYVLAAARRSGVSPRDLSRATGDEIAANIVRGRLRGRPHLPPGEGS